MAEVALRVAYLLHYLLPLSGKKREVNHSRRNAELFDYVNVANYADHLPHWV